MLDLAVEPTATAVYDVVIVVRKHAHQVGYVVVASRQWTWIFYALCLIQSTDQLLHRNNARYCCCEPGLSFAFSSSCFRRTLLVYVWTVRAVSSRMCLGVLSCVCKCNTDRTVHASIFGLFVCADALAASALHGANYLRYWTWHKLALVTIVAFQWVEESQASCIDIVCFRYLDTVVIAWMFYLCCFVVVPLLFCPCLVVLYFNFELLGRCFAPFFWGSSI